MVSPLALPLRLLLQGDLRVVLVDQVCHVVAIRLLPLRHETMLQLPIKVSDHMLFAGSQDFFLSLLFLYRFVILQPLQKVLQVIFVSNRVFLRIVCMYFGSSVRPLKLVPLPRLFLLPHFKVRTVQIEIVFHQPMEKRIFNGLLRVRVQTIR